MTNYQNHNGEPFEPRIVFRDGMKCRFCGRYIRVREKAGFFRDQPTVHQWECRECLRSEPLTEFNKGWRQESDTSG